MIEFLSIVMLVFGILQIILFFKIWGMTNDVKKLTNHFLYSQKDTTETIQKTNSYDKDNKREYDKKLERIKPNDKVIRISDNKEMIVDCIENGKFFCKANSLEGYKWYSIYEIKTL